MFKKRVYTSSAKKIIFCYGYDNWMKERNKRKKLKNAEKWSKKFRTELIRNQTKAETAMFDLLSSAGMSFQFQKPFAFKSGRCRIVDFYFPEYMTAVELDGSSHDSYFAKKRDKIRANEFSREFPDVRFIRYRNEEVFKKDFMETLVKDLEYDETEELWRQYQNS